jgi:hypothetical protein
VVKQWFLSKLLDSLNNENVPEDFKQYVRAQDLTNENVSIMINSNPRMLFDVFDEHKVYIQITYYDGPKFWCSINGVTSENKHDSRIDAEEEAIQGAFTILETKL